MAWIDDGVRVLEKAFGTRSFCAADALKVLCEGLGFAFGTSYRLLSELRRARVLAVVGRGVYVFGRGKEKVEPRLSGRAERVRIVLVREGVPFMFTGPSVLFSYYHHLPRRSIDLLYVGVGGGGLAVEKSASKHYVALLNPRYEDVMLALELNPKKNIVIAREASEFYGSVKGVASIERAIVDLYFECTRKKIPIDAGEAGRVIASVFRSCEVNVSKLLKCGERRGIKSEVKALVSAFVPGVPDKIVAGMKRNEYVESVLAGEVEVR